jgi:hypothetical protein
VSATTVFAKRPWTQAELATLERDIATHEPVRTFTGIKPIWRERARRALDIEPELLASLLDITVEELHRFESEELPPTDESTYTFRKWLAASSAGADAVRAPTRVGNWPTDQLRQWEAAAAKRKRPVNPLKTDDDGMVL